MHHAIVSLDELVVRCVSLHCFVALGSVTQLVVRCVSSHCFIALGGFYLYTHGTLSQQLQMQYAWETDWTTRQATGGSIVLSMTNMTTGWWVYFVSRVNSPEWSQNSSARRTPQWALRSRHQSIASGCGSSPGLRSALRISKGQRMVKRGK
eukprot:8057818-Pyramimonas_sp.AAC.3